MANFRIYYPVHYPAIGPFATASGTPVHGVQSVEMNTSFSLEQVFELGQLELYENVENLPEIDMTIEKVLDGYPLSYHLATTTAANASLSARSNERCDIILSIFNDSQENSSGVATTQAYCSGMYVNTLTYTLPVEGTCTESVQFVGNDKFWITGSGTVWAGGTGFAFDGHFTGGDSPASGVQRRQHVKMGAAPTGSVWPRNLPGMTTVTGSGFNIESAGQFGAHLQDVTITTSLNREDLLELGRRKPYYKFASFPTAVDTTINMTAGGTQPGDYINADSESTANLSNEAIVIKMSDSTHFDLGTKNKLSSVSYSGGNSDGGVVTTVYSYQNFNILKVTASHDPAALA